MKSKRADSAKLIGLFCAPLILLAVAPTVQRAVVNLKATNATAQERAEATESLWEEINETPEHQNGFAELLIANGADVNARNSHSGWTFLTSAVLAGRESKVVMLLKHGANINAPDGTAATALTAAVGRVDPKMVHLLLKNGADVTLPGSLSVGNSGKVTTLTVTPLAAAKIMLSDPVYSDPTITMRTRQIIKMLKAAGAKE